MLADDRKRYAATNQASARAKVPHEARRITLEKPFVSSESVKRLLPNILIPIVLPQDTERLRFAEMLPLRRGFSTPLRDWLSITEPPSMFA